MSGMRFQLCKQLNNMNCANKFVTFQQGLRTKRSKMKDDYHLPVVTRPERETRYPGIKKAKPSMVQGLNEHQYNQISNGRKVPGDRADHSLPLLTVPFHLYLLPAHVYTFTCLNSASMASA